MKMTTAEFFEAEARATKSFILSAYLADHDVTVEKAVRAHTDQWTKWATAAGVHDPSAITISVVVELLRHKLELRAVLAETDPFSGFGDPLRGLPQ